MKTGRILFVLPKIGSKLELSLKRLLRANLENLSVDQKDQRRRSVCVGRQIFPNCGAVSVGVLQDNLVLSTELIR